MYAYGGNNPVRYVDPDGNLIISQFFLNLVQVSSGVLEVAGGILAEGVSAGVSTFAIIDGIYNIGDGIIGMVSACADKSYDGAIAETTKAVVIATGVSKEGQALAGSIATMADCLIDMKVTSGIKFAKGIRNTSRLANGIDRVNDVIGKSQLANSGFTTVKASNKYSKTKTGESLFDKVSKANATQEKRNEIMDRYHEHH